MIVLTFFFRSGFLAFVGAAFLRAAATTKEHNCVLRGLENGHNKLFIKLKAAQAVGTVLGDVSEHRKFAAIIGELGQGCTPVSTAHFWYFSSHGM